MKIETDREGGKRQRGEGGRDTKKAMRKINGWREVWREREREKERGRQRERERACCVGGFMAVLVHVCPSLRAIPPELKQPHQHGAVVSC